MLWTAVGQRGPGRLSRPPSKRHICKGKLELCSTGSHESGKEVPKDGYSMWSPRLGTSANVLWSLVWQSLATTLASGLAEFGCCSGL
uniref:Bm11579 n=1 Tax=Brugia malayi TaxID=6279 RepID=A0A1I9GD84_BRUMA|nr:Bm11579 [Brugia malayi]